MEVVDRVFDVCRFIVDCFMFYFKWFGKFIGDNEYVW